MFLAEGYPSGPGRPDLAVELLDKGFANNPTKWQYLYDKAFVVLLVAEDYRQAAHWFSEAAKVPGSPAWMPGLAAFMLGQGGDRRSSRFLWQQMRDTAEQQYMRDNADVPSAAARHGRRRRPVDDAAAALPSPQTGTGGDRTSRRLFAPAGCAPCPPIPTACRS